MQAVLEKAPVDDPTVDMEAAVEAVTDFLKASAQTPPALAAPKLTATAVTVTALDSAGVPMPMTYAAGGPVHQWQAEAWKSFYYDVEYVTLVEHPKPYGVTADQVLTAGGGWCNPGRPMVEHGTGEPDVEWLSQLRVGPVTDQEVAVFLDACAERLNRFGWVAGALRLGEYACAAGAIGVRYQEAARAMGAARAITLQQRARELLRAHLGLGATATIEAWNDTPGRTKREVVQAFRDAAQAVKAVAATGDERAAIMRKWFIEPVGYQVLV